MKAVTAKKRLAKKALARAKHIFFRDHYTDEQRTAIEHVINTGKMYLPILEESRL